MKKCIILPWSILLTTVLVSAQNVHFVTGPKAVDAGTQLVVSGKLSGLGVGDVTILISASGLADVECTNPGGNVAPGQDTTFEASGSVTLPVAKNGTVTFSVATAAPGNLRQACPNNSWSGAALDVSFSGGVVTVLQGGQIVVQQSL